MIPPKIDRSRVKSPITSRFGDNLMITLVISGIPAPGIRWFIGTRELGPNHANYRIRQKRNYYGVYIKYVTEELNEGISALASNSFGEDFVKFDIKVYKVLKSKYPRGSRQRSKSETRPPENTLFEPRKQLTLVKPRVKSKSLPRECSFTNRQYQGQRSPVSRWISGSRSLENILYDSVDEDSYHSGDSGFPSPFSSRRQWLFHSTDDIYKELKSPTIPSVLCDSFSYTEHASVPPSPVLNRRSKSYDNYLNKDNHERTLNISSSVSELLIQPLQNCSISSSPREKLKHECRSRSRSRKNKNKTSPINSAIKPFNVVVDIPLDEGDGCHDSTPPQGLNLSSKNTHAVKEECSLNRSFRQPSFYRQKPKLKSISTNIQKGCRNSSGDCINTYVQQPVSNVVDIDSNKKPYNVHIIDAKINRITDTNNSNKSTAVASVTVDSYYHHHHQEFVNHLNTNSNCSSNCEDYYNLEDYYLDLDMMMMDEDNPRHSYQSSSSDRSNVVVGQTDMLVSAEVHNPLPNNAVTKKVKSPTKKKKILKKEKKRDIIEQDNAVVQQVSVVITETTDSDAVYSQHSALPPPAMLGTTTVSVASTPVTTSSVYLPDYNNTGLISTPRVDNYLVYNNNNISKSSVGVDGQLDEHNLPVTMDTTEAEITNKVKKKKKMRSKSSEKKSKSRDNLLGLDSGLETSLLSSDIVPGGSYNVMDTTPTIGTVYSDNHLITGNNGYIPSGESVSYNVDTATLNSPPQSEQMTPRKIKRKKRSKSQENVLDNSAGDNLSGSVPSWDSSGLQNDNFDKQRAVSVGCTDEDGANMVTKVKKKKKSSRTADSNSKSMPLLPQDSNLSVSVNSTSVLETDIDSVFNAAESTATSPTGKRMTPRQVKRKNKSKNTEKSNEQVEVDISKSLPSLVQETDLDAVDSQISSLPQDNSVVLSYTCMTPESETSSILANKKVKKKKRTKAKDDDILSKSMPSLVPKETKLTEIAPLNDSLLDTGAGDTTFDETMIDGISPKKRKKKKGKKEEGNFKSMPSLVPEPDEGLTLSPPLVSFEANVTETDKVKIRKKKKDKDKKVDEVDPFLILGSNNNVMEGSISPIGQPLKHSSAISDNVVETNIDDDIDPFLKLKNEKKNDDNAMTVDTPPLISANIVETNIDDDDVDPFLMSGNDKKEEEAVPINTPLKQHPSAVSGNIAETNIDDYVDPFLMFGNERMKDYNAIPVDKPVAQSTTKSEHIVETNIDSDLFQQGTLLPGSKQENNIPTVKQDVDLPLLGNVTKTEMPKTKKKRKTSTTDKKSKSKSTPCLIDGEDTLEIVPIKIAKKKRKKVEGMAESKSTENIDPIEFNDHKDTLDSVDKFQTSSPSFTENSIFSQVNEKSKQTDIDNIPYSSLETKENSSDKENSYVMSVEVDHQIQETNLDDPMTVDDVLQAKDIENVSTSIKKTKKRRSTSSERRKRSKLAAQSLPALLQGGDYIETFIDMPKPNENDLVNGTHEGNTLESPKKEKKIKKKRKDVKSESDIIDAPDSVDNILPDTESPIKKPKKIKKKVKTKSKELDVLYTNDGMPLTKEIVPSSVTDEIFQPETSNITAVDKAVALSSPIKSPKRKKSKSRTYSFEDIIPKTVATPDKYENFGSQEPPIDTSTPYRPGEEVAELSKTKEIKKKKKKKLSASVGQHLESIDTMPGVRDGESPPVFILEEQTKTKMKKKKYQSSDDLYNDTHMKEDGDQLINKPGQEVTTILSETPDIKVKKRKKKSSMTDGLVAQEGSLESGVASPKKVKKVKKKTSVTAAELDVSSVVDGVEQTSIVGNERTTTIKKKKKKKSVDSLLGENSEDGEKSVKPKKKKKSTSKENLLMDNIDSIASKGTPPEENFIKNNLTDVSQDKNAAEYQLQDPFLPVGVSPHINTLDSNFEDSFMDTGSLVVRAGPSDEVIGDKIGIADAGEVKHDEKLDDIPILPAKVKEFEHEVHLQDNIGMDLKEDTELQNVETSKEINDNVISTPDVTIKDNPNSDFLIKTKDETPDTVPHAVKLAVTDHVDDIVQESMVETVTNAEIIDLSQTNLDSSKKKVKKKKISSKKKTPEGVEVTDETNASYSNEKFDESLQQATDVQITENLPVIGNLNEDANRIEDPKDDITISQVTSEPKSEDLQPYSKFGEIPTPLLIDEIPNKPQKIKKPKARKSKTKSLENILDANRSPFGDTYLQNQTIDFINLTNGDKSFDINSVETSPEKVLDASINKKVRKKKKSKSKENIIDSEGKTENVAVVNTDENNIILTENQTETAQPALRKEKMTPRKVKKKSKQKKLEQQNHNLEDNISLNSQNSENIEVQSNATDDNGDVWRPKPEMERSFATSEVSFNTAVSSIPDVNNMDDELMILHDESQTPVKKEKKVKKKKKVSKKSEVVNENEHVTIAGEDVLPNAEPVLVSGSNDLTAVQVVTVIQNDIVEQTPPVKTETYIDDTTPQMDTVEITHEIKKETNIDETSTQQEIAIIKHKPKIETNVDNVHVTPRKTKAKAKKERNVDDVTPQKPKTKVKKETNIDDVIPQKPKTKAKIETNIDDVTPQQEKANAKKEMIIDGVTPQQQQPKAKRETNIDDVIPQQDSDEKVWEFLGYKLNEVTKSMLKGFDNEEEELEKDTEKKGVTDNSVVVIDLNTSFRSTATESGSEEHYTDIKSIVSEDDNLDGKSDREKADSLSEGELNKSVDLIGSRELLDNLDKKDTTKSEVNLAYKLNNQGTQREKSKSSFDLRERSLSSTMPGESALARNTSIDILYPDDEEDIPYFDSEDSDSVRDRGKSLKERIVTNSELRRQQLLGIGRIKIGKPFGDRFKSIGLSSSTVKPYKSLSNLTGSIRRDPPKLKFTPWKTPTTEKNLPKPTFLKSFKKEEEVSTPNSKKLILKEQKETVTTKVTEEIISSVVSPQKSKDIKSTKDNTIQDKYESTKKDVSVVKESNSDISFDKMHIVPLNTTPVKSQPIPEKRNDNIPEMEVFETGETLTFTLTPDTKEKYNKKETQKKEYKEDQKTEETKQQSPRYMNLMKPMSEVHKTINDAYHLESYIQGIIDNSLQMYSQEVADQRHTQDTQFNKTKAVDTAAVKVIKNIETSVIGILNGSDVKLTPESSSKKGDNDVLEMSSIAQNLATDMKEDLILKQYRHEDTNKSSVQNVDDQDVFKLESKSDEVPNVVDQDHSVKDDIKDALKLESKSNEAPNVEQGHSVKEQLNETETDETEDSEEEDDNDDNEYSDTDSEDENGGYLIQGISVMDDSDISALFGKRLQRLDSLSKGIDKSLEDICGANLEEDESLSRIKADTKENEAASKTVAQNVELEELENRIILLEKKLVSPFPSDSKCVVEERSPKLKEKLVVEEIVKVTNIPDKVKSRLSSGSSVEEINSENKSKEKSSEKEESSPVRESLSGGISDDSPVDSPREVPRKESGSYDDSLLPDQDIQEAKGVFDLEDLGISDTTSTASYDTVIHVSDPELSDGGNDEANISQDKTPTRSEIDGAKTPTPTDTCSSSENENGVDTIIVTKDEPSFRQTYRLNRKASQDFEGSFEDLVELNDNVEDIKEDINQPSNEDKGFIERHRSVYETLTFDLEPTSFMKETTVESESVFLETCNSSTGCSADDSTENCSVLKQGKIEHLISDELYEKQEVFDVSQLPDESKSDSQVDGNTDIELPSTTGVIEPSWNQTDQLNQISTNNSSTSSKDLMHLNNELDKNNQQEYIPSESDGRSITTDTTKPLLSSPISITDNSKSPDISPISKSLTLVQYKTLGDSKQLQSTDNQLTLDEGNKHSTGNQLALDEGKKHSTGNQLLLEASVQSLDIDSSITVPEHDRTVPYLSISTSDDTDTTGAEDKDSDVSSDEDNVKIGGYNISAISDSDKDSGSESESDEVKGSGELSDSTESTDSSVEVEACISEGLSHRYYSDRFEDAEEEDSDEEEIAQALMVFRSLQTDRELHTIPEDPEIDLEYSTEEEEEEDGTSEYDEQKDRYTSEEFEEDSDEEEESESETDTDNESKEMKPDDNADDKNDGDSYSDDYDTDDDADDDDDDKGDNRKHAESVDKQAESVEDQISFLEESETTTDISITEFTEEDVVVRRRHIERSELYTTRTTREETKTSPPSSPTAYSLPSPKQTDDAQPKTRNIPVTTVKPTSQYNDVSKTSSVSVGNRPQSPIGASAAPLYNRPGDMADTLFYEKALMESFFTNVGSIVFLIFAIIVFHLMDQWFVKDNF